MPTSSHSVSNSHVTLSHEEGIANSDLDFSPDEAELDRLCLRTILHIHRLTTISSTVEDLLQQTLDHFLKVLPLSFGIIHQPQFNAGTKIISTGVTAVRDTLSTEMIQSLQEISYTPGQGGAGRAFLSGGIIWLSGAALKADPLAEAAKRIPANGTMITFPVIADNRISYLISLHSHTEIPHTPLLEEVFLACGSALGRFVVHRKLENTVRHTLIDKEIITEINRLAMKGLPLDGLLQRILVIILTSHGLGMERKGAIFLVNREKKKLQMVAQHALSPVLIRSCNQLDFMRCLCGRVAAEGRTIYSTHVNELHDIHYEGMPPHGHYISPIKIHGETIGVLNLYVAENHQRSTAEEHFVTAVTETLAGIIHRYQTDDQLKTHTTLDNLTFLPNRLVAEDRLQQAISLAERKQSHVGLLYIGIDNFTKINDSVGHQQGDLILKEVASRLDLLKRDSDTVARFGGDEFIVILPSLETPTHTGAVAKKIAAAFSAPFVVEGEEAYLSLSIGITIYPGDDFKVEDLMHNGHSAMRRAKEDGGACHRYYTQEMNSQAANRLKVESGMRKGLKRNEFYLLYQPLISSESEQVIGVEALVRWRHPTLGEMRPDQFISLAEENGEIVPIGRWILQQACSDGVRWQRLNGEKITVAVNVSARQLHTATFIDDVTQAIKLSGISPSCLEIEITEGVLMKSTSVVQENIRQLTAMGIKLSIDDFGTGYSSISYLRQIPFSTLKVDKSFVDGITLNEEDAMLVHSIITLAKNMRLSVIGEGVETREQADRLKTFGCNTFQGYYFSRPIPASELEQLLLNSMPNARPDDDQ
ncbi:MAG: EAL domain-containing protein [Gammaproteobacteria bacterium]|nr:EAL domain-containing protein [Gammaproteobacteria bacterium]